MRSGASARPSAYWISSSPAAGCQITGALRLVQGQRLRRVAGDGLQQCPLVAAAGNPDVDPSAAQTDEQLAEGTGLVRVVGQSWDQDLARDGLFTVLAVELQEEAFNQLAGRSVVGLVGDPAALSADPSAAYVEDVHRDLEWVLGQGHDVRVGGVAQHDCVLLHRPLERRDVVAKPGRPLVIGGGSRGPHLSFQPADIFRRLAVEERDEIVDDLAVLVSADPPDARRRALADVAEQAGPADLCCPPEARRRSSFAPGRPSAAGRASRGSPRHARTAEISNAPLLRSPHDHGSREPLVQRHGQVRVALVVAIADVEARVELLDPGVLELECFDLGTYHGPLDLGGAGDHRQGARMERGEVLEVRVEPGSQGLRLADIEGPGRPRR